MVGRGLPQPTTRPAHHDQACEGIGLKPNRVGGLTKSRRIRDLCVQVGLRLNIEDTGGTALADTAAVHLAQATPARYRRGTWFCHEMINVDPIIGRARNLGGVTCAPDAPGRSGTRSWGSRRPVAGCRSPMIGPGLAPPDSSRMRNPSCPT
ncbi:MAG: hypothetical protein OXK16_03625 [bacterium]|nr:hypothetical protein [bacterium]